MSSAIFGRGTHTQIGSMHRAESINRELAEIRELLKEVKEVPVLVRELKAAVQDMHARLDALHVPHLTPAVTQEQLRELEIRIDALKVLQTPQVTIAALQSLEKKLDMKISDILHSRA